ncbi:MAG: hypothetical protein DMF17_13020 [Verrucomicrobia bacterium]|nr:MAG: hypothetical protein DMF17_13020 [Verrucomicrobiota bacterium]
MVGKKSLISLRSPAASVSALLKFCCVPVIPDERMIETVTESVLRLEMKISEMNVPEAPERWPAAGTYT